MSFDSGKEPTDELDLLVGSTVAGKYHVDRLIGRGGMGAVFQATHAAIGKRVALKFLGARTSQDGDAATRFQREAEAASLAESPHIVQIFDSGRSEQGLPFLVMELLTGEDLRQRLLRELRLDAETSVRIGVQVLKALRQAHAAGIVHRDLKPDNVFLCQRDDEPSFVKIVDFGISKLQRRDIDTLTHEGAVLGTAFYMSPEQAQSFPDIDGRTDLFSVGAILYEMLTGEPPHSGPTYEAVLIAICTRDSADVRGKAPAVPESLARVIARALQRDRQDRYASAGEMLTELEASLGEQTPATKTLAESSPGPRHRYRTLVLALVAGLGGFAIAAHLVTRRSGERDARATTTTTRRPAPVVSALPAATPPPASAAAPDPSIGKASLKAAPSKLHETPKTAVKPAPTASSGVAGGLGLSTREP